MQKAKRPPNRMRCAKPDNVDDVRKVEEVQEKGKFKNVQIDQDEAHASKLNCSGVASNRRSR